MSDQAETEAIAEALHDEHVRQFEWMRGDELSARVPASECGNCQRYAVYVAASGLLIRPGDPA